MRLTNSISSSSWKNNLIHLNAQAPSVFIQTQESDPKRRFLMLTEAGLDTARNKVLYSHDGIRWVQSEKVPVSSGRNTFSANGSWIDSLPAIGAFTVGSSSASEAPRRLFVGCHNRDLRAFNLNDGAGEWRFPTFNWILSNPAVAHYKAYFGSLDGNLQWSPARAEKLSGFSGARCC